jgi:hypothetical protein
VGFEDEKVRRIIFVLAVVVTVVHVVVEAGDVMTWRRDRGPVSAELVRTDALAVLIPVRANIVIILPTGVVLTGL